jgi:hypothetical protein
MLPQRKNDQAPNTNDFLVWRREPSIAPDVFTVPDDANWADVDPGGVMAVTLYEISHVSIYFIGVWGFTANAAQIFAGLAKVQWQTPGGVYANHPALLSTITTLYIPTAATRYVSFIYQAEFASCPIGLNNFKLVVQETYQTARVRQVFYMFAQPMICRA